MFSEEVISLPAGQNPENGLYHFINHPPHKNELKKQGYVFKSSRLAWLVTIPAIDATNQLEPIYKNYPTIKVHLRIDCKFTKTNPFLSPYHYTEAYTNAEHTRKVHVFFDIDGKFKAFQIKEYAHAKPDVSNEITDPSLEKHSRARAAPYQARLKDLINYKNQRYLEIYSNTFELERAISSLLEEKPNELNLELISSKAHDYKKQIGMLGLYNELIERDGRQNFFDVLDMLITKYTQVLKEAMEKVEKNDKVIEMTHETLEPLISSTIVPTPIIIDPLFQRVTQLMESYKISPLNVNYSDLLDIEKELVLTKLFNESKKFNHDAEQYRVQIKKLMQKQAEKFKQYLFQGNLDAVTLLFHQIEPYIQLNQTYYDLLDQLIKNSYTTQKQVNITDVLNFLHLNSSVYRMVFRHRQDFFIIEQTTPTQKTHGPLASMVLDTNTESFEMFLKQGILPNSVQTNENNNAYEVLYLIIMLYKESEDAQKKEALYFFINLLFQYGGSLKHTSRQSFSTTAEEMEQVKKTMGVKANYGTLTINDSANTLLRNFEKYFKNYIPFARYVLWHDKQLLIQLMPHLLKGATEEDLVELYCELTLILYSNEIFSFNIIELYNFPSILVCPTFEEIEILANQSSCPESIKIKSLWFCFSPKNENDVDSIALVDLVIMYLRTVLTICHNFNLFDARIIQNEIKKRGILYFKNGNYEHAVTAFQAAIFAAFIKKNPECIDHEEMIMLYHWQITVFEKSKLASIETYQVLIKHYVDNLLPEQQEELKKRSAYKICNSIIKDRTTPPTSLGAHPDTLFSHQPQNQPIVEQSHVQEQLILMH